MKSNLSVTLALIAILSSPVSWAIVHTGSILETMNSGGYTYAKIKENGKEFWVAGVQSVVKVGDKVSFNEQMNMPDFTSKTLNRTFKQLMFIDKMSQGNQVKNNAVVSAKSMHRKIAAPVVTVQKVRKADGGFTVAELFNKKSELKGKNVKVRGTVVKVSNGIMKKNWIHIQDGTGVAGSKDIVFLSKTATATVGDVVIASGTLVTNQDFGYGYKYPVMVEDASFEVGQ